MTGRPRRRARARQRRTGGFETTVGVAALLALLVGVRPGLVFLALGVVVALDVAATVARRRHRRRRLRVLQGFLALTPNEFEQTVARLLRRMGFDRVRVVGGAGDLCADITCRDPAGRRAVVQCKRRGPGHHVSSPDLQTAIGMAFVHHHAGRLLYVTTAAFTKAARELARAHPVWLVDGDELVALWARHMLGVRPGSEPTGSESRAPVRPRQETWRVRVRGPGPSVPPRV